MKNSLSRREIEELLTPQDSPEPPAGLVDRIKAEIPETLPTAHLAPVVQGRFGVARWRPLLAAASLVAAVGAGWLGYRTMQVAEVSEPPSADRAKDQAPLALPAVPAPPAPPPPAMAAPRPQDSGGDAARLDALGYTAPTGKLVGERQPATEPVQPVEVPKLEEFDGSPLRVGGNESGVPAGVPGYVHGGVSGGVPGGVPGGTIGGVSGGAPGGSPGGTVSGVSGSVPGGVAGGSVTGIPSGAPSGYRDELRRTRGYGQESGAIDPRKNAAAPEPAQAVGSALAPTTGGEKEPNEEPYGDVFFEDYGVNPFVDTDEDHLSTFGLDVDTGSYTVMRRYLRDGNLPPHEAIRLEELINYFHYGDAPPSERGADFALYAEGAPTPFAHGERYRLLRLAVKAREIRNEDRKPASLIFVVDVSGSMDVENRLGLVKQALGLLLGELQDDDRVGLVIYGSTGRVLLAPTSDLGAIHAAIQNLRAEGSTNAEEGLRLAYELAERSFRPGAINRLVLCSDGVANVGATGPDSILERIGVAAKKGIELTTVGFGMGNYNDKLMEQLADKGDGRYAYVDDLSEARRIFVEDLTGTLQTVAADAKVQVELNPAVVARWRLLGYENRDIADRDFRNDKIDAGEVGAGHTVTALYVIKLQPDAPLGATAATLRLRYRSKASGEVVETAREIRTADFAASWEQAPRALRLASVVAELGEVLKGSYWAKEADLEALLARAQRVSADFPGNADVAELAGLVGKVMKLEAAAGKRRGDGE